MRFTIVAVQSLDGFITRHDTPGSGFASDADRVFFKQSLQNFDCCVMGGETYRNARDQIRNSLMPARLRIVVTRSPGSYLADAVPGKLEFSDNRPQEISTLLSGRGFRQAAVLGGSQIHSLFLEAGLVDEIWLTVEPFLFGKGTPLLAKRTDVRLELASSQPLSQSTFLLKYRVAR